jgi:hypothetical protein
LRLAGGGQLLMLPQKPVLFNGPVFREGYSPRVLDWRLTPSGFLLKTASPHMLSQSDGQIWVKFLKSFNQFSSIVFEICNTFTSAK